MLSLPLMAVILAQVSLSAFGAYGPGPTSCCPDYWTSFQDKCYRIFGQNSVPWAKAEDHCVKEGRKFGRSGHLVSINSAAESEFVKILWNTASGNRIEEPVWRNMYWIGFTDRYYEGHYRWSDGSSYYYENWHKGEPNNHGGGQDCAVVWDYQKNGRATWDDQQCYNKHPFICEMPQ